MRHQRLTAAATFAIAALLTAPAAWSDDDLTLDSAVGGAIGGASASRAADTMHIIVCVDGDVEIENMAHCFDVEAPRCDIGADQKFYFAFLEGFERVGSLKLIHITVE